MTTAEALERLNDAAFERLAFRSLREFATDCHAVIHMSMNAQEKTVPGPLDRFGRVQQVNPSRFVMIAATTTKPPKLKAKWLALLASENTKPKSTGSKSARSKKKSDAPSQVGRSDEGRQASRKPSRREPNSLLHPVPSNEPHFSQLENPARGAGELAGLEVRFLEQSQLRDFIDTSLSDSWLRQEYPSIEADQVSLLFL